MYLRIFSIYFHFCKRYNTDRKVSDSNEKIRIGVVGAGRGTSMINYSEYSGMSELVAICDKNEEILEVQKKALNDDKIRYYKDFDQFINHDMDAVVLAN